MYEGFTDRARKVMQLSSQEARRFNHEYIGTEHVLLGLIKEGSGVAAGVLKSLDIDLSKIRLEIEKLVQRGRDKVGMSWLPQTPRVKKAIDYAIEESRSLNHDHVGTEHLLLGLLRDSENVAAQLLMNQGLKFEQVREVLRGATSKFGSAPRTQNEIEDLPEPLRRAIAEFDAEIRRFTLAKEQAIGNQDYELAARQRDEAEKTYRKREALVRDWIASRAVDPFWLSANDGAALKLAQRISGERRWDLMPRLADALEQAGCTDAELLNHCRQPGEHSNNCWVVDLLLTQA